MSPSEPQLSKRIENSTSKLAALDHRHLWHPFTQMKDWLAEEPVIIESGHGATLRDTEGREYLDGNSSIWTNLHGHQHPVVTAAIKQQLDQIAHSSFLGLSNRPAIELAAALAKLTGLPRVFFSDDGSTAMEAAIKMALQYWQHRGQPGRQRFVAFADAYHGDTLGAVSIGGIDLFHKAYRPLTFEVVRARQLSDLPAGDDIAGVVIEPLIQGAAGMKLWPSGMLRDLADWCRQSGALLIVDEVMTGFGRTGTLFACQQENVVPDLMAVAKGLTGGYLPLAATLATEEIFQAFLGEYREFKTFFHGHSYTGNQLGCAAALASLRVFAEDNVLAKIADLGALLHDGLNRCRSVSSVQDVRCLGLIGAVEIGPYPLEAQMGIKVCRELRRRGVLTRPIGNVIVLMPPYCVTKSQLQRMTDAVYDAIAVVTDSAD